MLDVSKLPYNIHIDLKVFKQTENLKFLNIYNYRPYEELNLISMKENNPNRILLPNKLRLLQWDAYPFTTLPSSIITDCLVEILLCHSNLTTLWSGSSPVCYQTKLILYMRF